MSNDILVKIGADVANFSRDMNKVTNDLQNIGKNTEKSNVTVGKLAKSLGLVAAGAKAFEVLKNSVGDAVKRFDTLNQFPKVLEALGVSAEEADRSVNRLSDGIDGLPTKLDEIASTAQRMYTSFGNMDKATESALALNNALLGSGSSAEQAGRGTEMYLKMLQTGQVDLQTWRSLSETMDVGLVKIAEGFGYAGKSAKDDLYDALKDGSVTIDDFNDKLIEVGTGTGVMAELARENSLGLGTSLKNLGTAVSRNVANIIETFDNMSQEITGKSIAEHIDGMKVIINNSFDAIRKAIELTTPLFKLLVTVVKTAYQAFKPLSPIIYGVATALIALKVARTIGNLFGAATTAGKAFTGAIGLMTGKVKIATIATKAFGTAQKLLGGPIGIAVAAVGALVGGTIALVKWFRRESDEAKKLNAETEKLADETENLTDSVESSTRSYEDKQSSTEAEIKNNEDLAKKVKELSDIEHKSASEKEMLKAYTDELNESMDDLNLVYNEETDALSMSSEHIQARIDLMGEQDKANDAMKRAKEITEEQVKVEEKLGDVSKLREEWNDKLEDGSVKSREHKKAVEELDEQEQGLNKTLGELKEQHKSTEAQVEESMGAIAKATDEATKSQELSYESLTDSQKELVDEMKSGWQDVAEVSTNMFEKISDEANTTFEEMQEILDHNIKATADWADNIKYLSDNGVDEAFIDVYREKGPESAAELQQLVDANIDEVKELSKAYVDQAELSLDQWAKVNNVDTKVVESVRHLVEEADMSLGEAINAAGFDKHGEEIAEGTARGIRTKANEAALSVFDMVDDMKKVFADENEIKSPSRLYQRLAGDIPMGTKMGIDGKKSSAVSSVKTMVSAMTANMNGIKSSFSSIGRESIAGLSRGLDSSKGSLFAKASSIASSIAGKMRSALKIASPSRVMADIGRWIPEGLADGIDGNAKSVYDAVQAMSSGIQTQNLSLDYDTPGGLKSSLAGAVSGTVDVNSREDRIAGAIDSLRRDMANMRIEMEGERVGKIVSPFVNEVNAVDAAVRGYFD